MMIIHVRDGVSYIAFNKTRGSAIKLPLKYSLVESNYPVQKLENQDVLVGCPYNDITVDVLKYVVDFKFDRFDKEYIYNDYRKAITNALNDYGRVGENNELETFIIVSKGDTNYVITSCKDLETVNEGEIMILGTSRASIDTYIDRYKDLPVEEMFNKLYEKYYFNKKEYTFIMINNKDYKYKVIGGGK